MVEVERANDERRECKRASVQMMKGDNPRGRECKWKAMESGGNRKNTKKRRIPRNIEFHEVSKK